MRLRELTKEEIEKLATRPNVRKIAVENFLMSMGNDERTAMLNLSYDAGLYKWNVATVKAIRDGIQLAKKEVQK
jgi:hypothetical protein